MLLSTHLMYEAERLADQIVILAQGRVCGQGTVADLCRRTGCVSLEDAFVALVEGQP